MGLITGAEVFAGDEIVPEDDVGQIMLGVEDGDSELTGDIEPPIEVPEVDGGDVGDAFEAAEPLRPGDLEPTEPPEPPERAEDVYGMSGIDEAPTGPSLVVRMGLQDPYSVMVVAIEVGEAWQAVPVLQVLVVLVLVEGEVEPSAPVE